MTTRKEILNLLAQGKITADEAAEMLSQASSATAIPVVEEPTALKTAVVSEGNGESPKWFRVRVRNLETGKNRVSVNIPLGMLKFGMRIGKQFTSELHNLNLGELETMMHDMKTGMLVEVEDEDSNEHVQVFLE